MLTKFTLPESQIILSERFCEVDSSFLELRVIRAFVRNFVQNSRYAGLKFVHVFVIPSLVPNKRDLVYIYSTMWLNSRSLKRLKVYPNTLYFTSRIELL